MNSLILTAIVLRVGLLIFGSWQDTHLAVKYTDIDYEVYTDAAQFMVHGGSPYQRSTYRYSPLLAALLTPNILIHKSFGKVLFALADIIAALLMQRLLQRKYKFPNNDTGTTTAAKNSKNKITTNFINLALALWLFSPFTVSISTRGNGEALVTCMLLAMLDLLERKYFITSGMLFGLAVHWRVYPIIYSLPILKYLATSSGSSSKGRSRSIPVGNRPRTRSSTGAINNNNNNTSGGGGGGEKEIKRFWKGKTSEYTNVTNPSVWSYPTTFFNTLFSIHGLKFGTAAAIVFLSLGIGLYRLYGFEFLHETYLYHATRIDPRHNFSPYYYPAYLGTELDSNTVTILGDSGNFFTLATLILQLSLGWTFSNDLSAAFFLQTVAFVAFNKVATAQYFVWYFSWLPLVLPSLLLHAPNKKRLCVISCFWAASLGHWLAWAYQLEFAGNSVHIAVWCAGLLWIVANAALLRELIFALRERN